MVLMPSMCCSFAEAGTDGCLSSQFVSAEIDICAWICDKHVQTAKKNFNLRSKKSGQNNGSMVNGADHPNLKILVANQPRKSRWMFVGSMELEYQPKRFLEAKHS